MHEPQFTQGKWDFMYVGKGRVYITFNGIEFPGERNIDDETSEHELKADARLMNATPVMYDLLRKFVIDGVLDRKEAIAVIENVDTPEAPEENCEIPHVLERDSLRFLKH